MNVPRSYSMQIKNFINAGLIKRQDLSMQTYQTYVDYVNMFRLSGDRTPAQVAEYAATLQQYTGAMLKQFVPNWQTADFQKYVEEINAIPF